MDKTTIFGIRNCDTMKRAFAWLKDHGIEFAFHDYRKAGVSREILGSWSTQVGWQKLLNTRGTTWRRLDEAERADMVESKAIELMQAHPGLIKRPVLVQGDNLLVGFDPVAYEHLFGA